MNTDKKRGRIVRCFIGVYRRASAALSLYGVADAARNLYRTRHSTTEQTHGRRGEDLAHRFLRRQGLTIVARNFHQRAGRGDPARFDLVNVVLTHPPEIVWIKDAFPISRTL